MYTQTHVVAMHTYKATCLLGVNNQQLSYDGNY